jgi:hypothetical protein
MVCTDSKSPGEETGKPTSITSTPMRSSANAICGEQALQASLSVKEKLQIALALERMGVDVMEVGFF